MISDKGDSLVSSIYRKALKEKMNIIDDNEINKSYVIDTKKFSLSKIKFVISCRFSEHKIFYNE